MVVAAVRFQVRVTGSDSPVGAATDRVLAGFRRAGSDRGRGQVPASGGAKPTPPPPSLPTGASPSTGLRDAAILAVASDAMLRVSELAALRVGDIGAGRRHAATVTVRHSKTDQEGEGAVLFVGAPTVSRVRAWLRAASIESGPIFRRVRRGDKVIGAASLSTRAARDIIKRRAADADLQGRFSGHSLRVGSAQSLAAGGASLVEMQTAGRWQSPAMPGHYARGQLAARGAVARLRYGT